MARTKQALQGGVRISDYLGMGVLADVVPLAIIKEVLAAHGKNTLRERKLPRELLVYYIIAMAFFSNINTTEVLKALLEVFSAIIPDIWKKCAGDSAISQARESLGDAVMQSLFQRTCKPIAEPGSTGSWYKKWRLVATDGSHFDLQDEEAIKAEYPKHSNGTEYPYPQLKFVALMEVGTHCMFAVAHGNDKDSEKKLAEKVLSSLSPGMLLLGDRYYMGYDTYTKILETGANVLTRARENMNLYPIETLADGSYLAKIYADRKDRRKDGGKIVRVIEYRVKENGKLTNNKYRLVTDIMDIHEAPAMDLVELYKERWLIETAYDEMKNHLKLPGHNLRSKRPDLVRQEFWGYVIAHFIVRSIIYRAAKKNNKDPDEMSFRGSVVIIARRSASALPFPPRHKGS